MIAWLYHIVANFQPKGIQKKDERKSFFLFFSPFLGPIFYHEKKSVMQKNNQNPPSCIMVKYGQTYFKNRAVSTAHVFKVCLAIFQHYA